jgi:hypothetical protein
MLAFPKNIQDAVDAREAAMEKLTSMPPRPY